MNTQSGSVKRQGHTMLVHGDTRPTLRNRSPPPPPFTIYSNRSGNASIAADARSVLGLMVYILGFSSAGGRMTEEELNSLIAHAHRRIDQLQKQLAEQQVNICKMPNKTQKKNSNTITGTTKIVYTLAW